MDNNTDVKILYATELLLDKHLDGCELYTPCITEFQRVCGIENPSYLESQLLKDGYFSLADEYELLQRNSLEDLKTILRSCGLKVSGKKSELINRIYNNSDVMDVFKNFDTRKIYFLSSKGYEFYQRNRDFIDYKNSGTLQIPIEIYGIYRMSTNLSYYHIAFNYFCNVLKIHPNSTINHRHVYEAALKKGDPIFALSELLEEFYLFLNMVDNKYIFDDFFINYHDFSYMSDIIKKEYFALIHTYEKNIYSLKNYFTEDYLFLFKYRINRDKTIITNDVFIKIVKSCINSTFDIDYIINNALSNYKKYYISKRKEQQ